MDYRVTCYLRGGISVPVEAESEDQAYNIVEEMWDNDELDSKIGQDIDIYGFDFLETEGPEGNQWVIDCHFSTMVDVWVEAGSKEEALDVFVEKEKKDELGLDLGDTVVFYLDPVDITTEDEEVDYFSDGFGFFDKVKA